MICSAAASRFPSPTSGKHRERIDLYPTHSSGEFALRPGIPRPLGATVLSRAINFAVYSRHGTQCTLVLFEPGGSPRRSLKYASFPNSASVTFMR